MDSGIFHTVTSQISVFCVSYTAEIVFYLKMLLIENYRNARRDNESTSPLAKLNGTGRTLGNLGSFCKIPSGNEKYAATVRLTAYKTKYLTSKV